MEQDAINKKITDTIHSLDAINRATTNPYLMTRLNAKIQALPAPSLWTKIGGFVSRPLVAGIGLVIIVMINVIAIQLKEDAQQPAENSTTVVANTQYDVNINVSSIYDIENREP